MAPIPLKSISSVSSEDSLNPASNLLSRVPGVKWLCAAENKSRTAEVDLELSKRAKIIALEICNFGSAFVEVLVSDSSSPEQHVTLLPVSMLMSSQESRSGRNKNKTAVYGREKLSAAATARKWNRVKIRCIQKYNREAQFGLRTISFFTETRDPGTDRAMISPLLRQPVMTTPPAVTTPKQEPSQSNQHRHRYPSLPSIPVNPQSSGATPSEDRPKLTPSRHRDKQGAKLEEFVEDYEFSGVERQSRLFRSCMRGKSDQPEDTVVGSNQILDRVSAEKEKYRDVLSPSYPRKRLLKRELPKAETMRDFLESYKERKTSVEMSGAWRKMASHDNDYEIGEEPEHTWGWNKFAGKPKKKSKSRPVKSSGVRRKKGQIKGWLTTRKKLDGMIQHCSDILSKAGHDGDDVQGSTAVGMESNEEEDLTTTEEEGECRKEKEEEEDLTTEEEGECRKEKEEEEEDLTTEEEGECVEKVVGVIAGDCKLDSACPHPEESKLGSGPGHTSSGTAPNVESLMVECPLCSSFFPSYAIELHASQCREWTHPSHPGPPDSFITID